MVKVLQVLLWTETTCYGRHGEVLNRTDRVLERGTLVGLGPVENLRFGGKLVEATAFEWENEVGKTYFLLSGLHIQGIARQLKLFHKQMSVSTKAH